MLKLQVNGEPRELDQPCPLTEALTAWGHQGRRFAVAIDGEFVPRGRYDQVTLRGGESIEVLSPMQGG